MKILLCTAILLLMVACPVYAEWDDADTGLLLLRIIDWGQTRTIATERETHHYSDGSVKYEYIYPEANPILGERPTLDEVNTYFACLILTDILINKYAPSKIRNFWLYSNLTIEVICIGRNYSFGINMKF